MKKEKITREIRVKFPPSLYDKMEQKCLGEYKSVSEVIRELAVQYVKEKDAKSEN